MFCLPLQSCPPGMSEIGILTYAVLFLVNLARSIYKIPFKFVEQKLRLGDQTGPVVNEIYHSISLISFNLIYLIHFLSNGNLAHACCPL